MSWLVWLGAGLALYWLLIGYWALRTAQRAHHRFSRGNYGVELQPRFHALVRTDYKRWNMQKIAVGCFTLFPLRILAFVTMMVGFIFFCLLLVVLGPRPIVQKMLSFYLNSYGKLVCRVLCLTEQKFTDKKIRTPILISNHVNWFDIFYIGLGYSPVSFVSKAEVDHWPIIGKLSQALHCIYVKRNSEEARQETRDAIRNRIQLVTKGEKLLPPLVIFPEGTTSNGKGLLTFKRGAFENMSSITAFCFKYTCEDFDMGLDQMSQTEHVVLMMAQWAKLTVFKLQFEPLESENPDQYQERIRVQMATKLGIQCTAGGFREKNELKQIRDATSKTD